MPSRKALILTALMVPLLALAHTGPGWTKPEQDAVTTETLDKDVRERLMSDAAHAWSYFERPLSGFPGMVSINVWREGSGYGAYDIATMWDTGSIILATISAHSIGLIDDDAFDKRVQGILAFLERATTVHKGARLPNFRSHPGTGRSVEAGYDTTDTGRLFVALHVLDRVTDGKYKVADLMGKWQIDATVVDGAMQDIKGRRMYPARSNIYRYYVSRGYELWSIPHAPVYSGPSPDLNKAAKDRFMKELASIGPISTEPSLNEIVELGGSPYAVTIAEALGPAQRARFEKTGNLTAVSEGPIDKEPWFTYQGYDLTRDGESAWTVYPWKTEARWATPEFAETFRMISSKAAFLWFAAYPDDYTRKLWEAVREKSRAEKYGYHSGVYEKSGASPTNIDVNTNATILSAIAYILNGRQPLVEAGAGS